MPQLNDKIVPDALYQEAYSVVKSRGGKCFLAVPDGPSAGCTNCNGGGKIVLQVVVGGPYESPETTGKETSLIYEGGCWYAVKGRPYQCPVCNGATPIGRTVRRPTAARAAQLATEMK